MSTEAIIVSSAVSESTVESKGPGTFRRLGRKTLDATRVAGRAVIDTDLRDLGHLARRPVVAGVEKVSEVRTNRAATKELSKLDLDPAVVAAVIKQMAADQQG